MTRPEDRQNLVADIAAACAAGARLGPACALLSLDARTVQRWQAEDGTLRADRRPEAVHPRPSHALTEAERAHIVAVANELRFASTPPARIVPALADEGIYLASEASFHRVLRDHGQMQRRGRARPPRTVGPPSTHIATGPGQVWCWDVTFLPSRVQGRWFYLYLILDLFSRKVVGFEVHDTDAAEHAAHLVRRTALAEGVHASLTKPVLHGDLAQARQWAAAFVHWYNHEHRHSGIRYVTPAERHVGDDGPILAARHALYQQARKANPRRWSGPTRNWAPIGAVTLNPERDSVVAAATQTLLSGSTGGPAVPPRPDGRQATARSGGDGRSTATRSHAQRSEHGEDGEHRTFAAASTVAASPVNGAPTTTKPHQ